MSPRISPKVAAAIRRICKIWPKTGGKCFYCGTQANDLDHCHFYGEWLQAK